MIPFFYEFRANSFFAMLMSKAKPMFSLTEPDAELTDADDFSDGEFIQYSWKQSQEGCS